MLFFWGEHERMLRLCFTSTESRQQCEILGGIVKMDLHPVGGTNLINSATKFSHTSFCLIVDGTELSDRTFLRIKVKHFEQTTR
jgi:hypothetical protein